VVVTYIPFLAGYFAEGLRVLQICLDSLRQNTPEPHDLFVFDNGSAPEVVSHLEQSHAEGRINYLFLSSKNLGKGGAWDIAFPAAPGEIIAYADGDVYFHPRWLSTTMTVLDTFPGVGMVSSRPLRTDPELFRATLRWAAGNGEVELERGSFIPWEVFREHDVNLGQPEEAVRQRYQQTEDVRLRYRGVEAMAGAVHWQFVARKEALVQRLPLALDRPMGQVRTLDERFDAAGYLRLMTTLPLARHLGNTVPPDLRPPDGSTRSFTPRAGRRHRFLDWGAVRRLLLALHNQIFRWYFRE
jgi:glycosyltransferase involved in cell wall biosynthesis